MACPGLRRPLGSYRRPTPALEVLQPAGHIPQTLIQEVLGLSTSQLINLHYTKEHYAPLSDPIFYINFKRT